MPLFQLKYHHTLRVRDLCVRIAQRMSWPEEDVAAAAAVGLLHDVGRFPQILDYGHFRDHDSFNHARRSMEIVRDGGWLSECPEDERLAILGAIDQHNHVALAEGLPERADRLARIIRDADKIDILMCVFDDLKAQADLTDRMPNPALLAQLGMRQPICYADVKSFPDMLVAWLVWPYDLNYAPSRQILRESGALGRIFDFLPDMDVLRQVRQDVETFLRSE
ncbi:MAG: hypothetical protein A2018_07015 [Alphaproteobacteria bacterium GWF2_58_20]|nr:MAG: hypothetical protein A2018_07015 [Alphaproteobacteria bacterium GWF2_58_20]